MTSLSGNIRSFLNAAKFELLRFWQNIDDAPDILYIRLGLVFNAAKFELLRFWQNIDDAPDLLYMSPDGGPIEEKDCLRDLGVRVSTDLTFQTQIDMVIKSGNISEKRKPADAHPSKELDPAKNQGLITGYDVKWQWSERRGRLAIPNRIARDAPSKVKKTRERSLGVHSAHLFNLLPKRLRNEDSGDFELFKKHLDIFLAMVPDQPTTSGMAKAALANSLLDLVRLVQNDIVYMFACCILAIDTA